MLQIKSIFIYAKDFYIFIIAGAIVFCGTMLLTTQQASAQQLPCSTCNCVTSSKEACAFKFQVELITDNSPDSWTYEICNQKTGKINCGVPGTGEGLSHFDFFSCDLGCLPASSSISIAQDTCLGCINDAALTCLPEAMKDPACGFSVDNPNLSLLKCELASKSCSTTKTQACVTNADCPMAETCIENKLDPGECVTVTVTVTNPPPELGTGPYAVLAKAGTIACLPEGCILGPSCSLCTQIPALSGAGLGGLALFLLGAGAYGLWRRNRRKDNKGSK